MTIPLKKIFSSPTLFEYASITVISAAYLFIFRTSLPIGDAHVFVGNLDRGIYIWNPNHLLTEPLSLLWWNFVKIIWPTLSALNSLKLLSGFATVLTLVFFYNLLIRLGYWTTSIRLAATFGLFASKNFMSMGLNEEIYMIQGPFIILSLTFAISWLYNPNKWHYLVLTGVNLGICTLFLSSNVFVAVFLLILIFLHAQHNNINNTLFLCFIFIASYLLIILPTLSITYYIDTSSSSFFKWLTSYRGDDDNYTSSLYGLSHSIEGVLISISRLIYNFFTNLIDANGLGTVLKSFIFSKELEFRPNYYAVVLSSILLFVTILMLLISIYKSYKLKKDNQFILVCYAWISGGLLFNFLWNDSSDQFWFQIIPSIWLFLLVVLRKDYLLKQYNSYNLNSKLNLINTYVILFVTALLFANTLSFATRYTFIDSEKNKIVLNSILNDGDLLITPGWDGITWLTPSEENNSIIYIRLMSIATNNSVTVHNFESLPEVITNTVSTGHDVYIARLYDLDSEAKPWDQLRKLGWPREKIIELLNTFSVKYICNIDDISFRKISLRPNSNYESGSKENAKKISSDVNCNNLITGNNL